MATKIEKGVFFQKMDAKGASNTVRSVYAQDDGKIVLADTCTCWPDYSKPQVDKGISFTVQRNPKCPIDQHRGGLLGAA